MISLLFAGCSINDDKVNLLSIKGNTMGTYYLIKYFEPELKDIKPEEFKLAVDSELRRINYIMSTYVLDSELSLLNVSEANEKNTLSPELALVIDKALKISEESNGAFDITVGPLVNAWGFGPDKTRKVPADKEIGNLKNIIGYKKIHLDLNSKILTKDKSKTYIDLSAIAKGYGVDRVGEFLKEKFKLKNFLVEIGGELRAWGKKGNKNWKIGVESPSMDPAKQGINKVVNISNLAVATSGNYRNFYKYGEEVFSHTIDPITGRPVKHRLLSATVFSNDCMTADAYATTLMVLGPELGIEFSEKNNLMTYLIFEKDKTLLYSISSKLNKFIEDNK